MSSKLKKKEVLSVIKKPIKEKEVINTDVKAIDESKEKFVCSYCNQELTNDSDFCRFCGTKVNIEKQINQHLKETIKSKFEIEKQKDLLNKTKELAKNIKQYIGYKGYIKYYYDFTSKVYEMYPLPKIRPVITLFSFSETFLLDKPSEFYKGHPVFSVVRTFPISVNFKFIKSLDELTGKFCMTGFSSQDINAKLRSPYIRRLFALRNLTTIQYLAIIMLNAISIMTTVFVCLIWLGGLK